MLKYLKQGLNTFNAKILVGNRTRFFGIFYQFQLDHFCFLVFPQIGSQNGYTQIECKKTVDS